MDAVKSQANVIKCNIRGTRPYPANGKLFAMPFFEKNIRVLEAKGLPASREIIAALKGAVPAPAVETSRPGCPTLFAPLESGAAIALHSSRDPVREAEKWVASNITGQAEEIVIAGFGLGYACEEAARLCPAARIHVVEPNIGTFAAALHYRDLEALISNPRVSFYAGPFELVHKPLVALLEQLSAVADESKTALLIHGPSLKTIPGEEKSFSDIFSYLNNSKRAGRGGTHERLCRENEALNADAVINSAAAGSLAGKFQGVPAILVAPGPSLQKNISLLRLCEQSAVIVAVDAALAPLAAHGVAPDFTVTIDPTKAAATFFSEESSAPTRLVFIPSSSPGAVAMFAPDRRYMALPCLDAREAGGRENRLFLAGSVSLTALDFCVMLGCNPIIFTGLDFAVKPEMSHIRGTKAGGMTVVKTRARECEGYFGVPVQSTDSLLLYLRVAEDYIRQSPPGLEFRDATEGGALIAGAAPVTLREEIFRMAGTRKPRIF